MSVSRAIMRAGCASPLLRRSRHPLPKHPSGVAFSDGPARTDCRSSLSFQPYLGSYRKSSSQERIERSSPGLGRTVRPESLFCFPVGAGQVPDREIV